jgi:hypothetical protein
MEALQHKNKIQMGGIEKENQAIKKKNRSLKHIPFTFENDDTPKQLLTRSLALLLKPNDWTQNQGKLLFTDYPLYIKHKAYS